MKPPYKTAFIAMAFVVSQLAYGDSRTPFLMDPVLHFCGDGSKIDLKPLPHNSMFTELYLKDGLCGKLLIASDASQHIIKTTPIPDMEPTRFQDFAVENLRLARGDEEILTERLSSPSFASSFGSSNPAGVFISSIRNRAYLVASVSEFAGRCTLAKSIHEEQESLIGTQSLTAVPVRFYSLKTLDAIRALEEEAAIKTSHDSKPLSRAIVRENAPPPSQTSLIPASVIGLIHGPSGAGSESGQREFVVKYKDVSATTIAVGQSEACVLGKPLLYRQWLSNPEVREATQGVYPQICLTPPSDFSLPNTQFGTDLVARYDSIAKLEAIKTAIITNEIAMASYNQAMVKPKAACAVMGADRKAGQLSLDLRYTVSKMDLKTLNEIEFLRAAKRRVGTITKAEIITSQNEMVTYTQRFRQATQTIDAERNAK